MSAPNRRDDPPPYPWLDDPSRMAGAVSPGTTIVMGGLLVAVGLFAVVLGVLGAPAPRMARIFTGLPIGLIGAFIVHMGTARRAWRRRNPGADPLEEAAQAGANVGSAWGNDSLFARIARGGLLVVCALIVLVCALAVRNAVTGTHPASAGEVVITVLLGVVAAVAGVLAATRNRRRRS